MKLTNKQLKQIIKEEMRIILNENFNEPIQVKDEIFYWSTSRPGEVPIGFMVPKSGPIQELIEAEQIFEEARKELNPSAPSRFSCVYVCPTLNGFCSEPRYGRSVYKVKVSGKVFYADAENWSGAVQRFERFKKIDVFKDFAEYYWEGLSQEQAMTDDDYLYYEALVDGTVEVIEKMYEK